MDSSSIMSFNNDSTYQTTIKGDYNNVTSVHELALHAMRDRCLLLQRRINALETDNMRLKLEITKSTETSPYIPLQEDEKMQLQQKIAELTKQKSQLMHHVFMVSTENQNLWNKLSTLKGHEKLKDTKQPLIRTNTYNQSTPKTSSNNQEKYNESSLDEISLKLINSYIQEKSQLVEQYEQMAQLQDDEQLLNMDTIGFTYMEDPATDSLKEIRCQTEKLLHMKQELAQQEKDLKLILAKVEAIVQGEYKCPSCAMMNSQKVISSEHKEIETSDSLANWATPTESSNYHNNFNQLTTPAYTNSNENKQEINEELVTKICPMCGQTFSVDISFSEFQSHVESHFMGENEPDSIDNIDVEHSFENII